MSKPVVWVVGTGGTIASKYDAKLGGHVAAVSAEDLAAAAPSLADYAEVRAVEHSRINSAGIDTSAAQTFTIQNTGTADLTKLAVTLAGASPGDFTLGALGATALAPNATATFTVMFAPITREIIL